MLKGVVSLVTGGASGLGRETVKHLASRGARVILADLPQSRGAEIVQSFKDNVEFAACDVSSEDDVRAAVLLCKEKFGQLDLAVNCAGLSRAFKISNPLSNTSMKLEEIEAVFKANVYGTFNVTRLAAQLMSKNVPKGDDQARGVVINVGSMSSEDGTIGQSAFAASKGAVSAMTLPAARDLAGLGIRVVTIAPGIFDTPLTSESCLTSKVKDYLTEQILFPKRFGTPAEFAQMVESVYCNPIINGTVVKLSGGLRMHADVRTVKGQTSKSS